MILAGLIVIFSFVKLRGGEIRWTPIVRMYREISAGKMQEYSDYVWDIYGHLENDEGDEVYIYNKELEDKTCMVSPYFAYGDHDENFKNYDASIVKFFGKKALYLYDTEE